MIKVARASFLKKEIEGNSEKEDEGSK